MEIKTEELLRRRPRRADAGYSVYNPFEVSASVASRHFVIKVFGPIEDVTQFSDAIDVFDAAGEDDLVEVQLSTPGGSMDATDTFLQAMHDCKGRVVMRASGGVHSCGSIILMHASEFTLSENFNMLIHNGSTGGYDDLNKFKAAAKHSTEYMEKVMRKTYEGFLTPEETQAMIDGKDFWLDGEEFMRRWYARQDYFKAKLKEAQLLLAEAEEEEPEVLVKAPRRKRSKVGE